MRLSEWQCSLRKQRVTYRRLAVLAQEGVLQRGRAVQRPAERQQQRSRPGWNSLARRCARCGRQRSQRCGGVAPRLQVVPHEQRRCVSGHVSAAGGSGGKQRARAAGARTFGRHAPPRCAGAPRRLQRARRRAGARKSGQSERDDVVQSTPEALGRSSRVELGLPQRLCAQPAHAQRGQQRHAVADAGADVAAGAGRRGRAAARLHAS